MLASALAFAFTSCEKEPEQNDDPNKENQEPEKPVEKSKEAKLLTFSLTAGEVTIEGTVYEEDKVVEIVYLPEQAAALTNATAVATYSEKATISPDPAVAADYTVAGGVKYTVTAEDGETAVEYTVEPVAATITVKCEPVWETPKTFGDFNLTSYSYSDGSVAFSGLNIVMHDLKVFDLDGNKVGDLNTTGLPHTKLFSMSNDEKGVLVATIALDKDGAQTDVEDSWAKSQLWAWKNGWDKAPEMIWKADDGNVARYMSASGDLAGDYIITIISPGRGVNGAMFHCFVGKGGQPLTDSGVWHAFNTTKPSNDGNWSQHLSAASGDPNGTFFYMDSMSGDNGVGVAYYARKGIDGEDVPLFGTVFAEGLVEEEAHGGSNQFGNYTVAHARGFKYNGVEYVVAASCGWTVGYTTIVPADPEQPYLLRTQGNSAGASKPSSAYIYDPATDTGHVIVVHANALVQRYDITRQIL